MSERVLPRVRAALVYDEAYLRYDFGKSHALRQERLRLAHDLIAAYELLRDRADEVRPEPALDAAIRRVHAPEYLETVRKVGANPSVGSPDYGLGTLDNPAFPGMYEAAALQCGGTMRACADVASGRRTRALNLGGGFHHAMRDKASGFCILNDVAVGIAALLEDHAMARILYVDVDAHHADGVQSIFYRDPRVLTISFHEDGRYLFPGTGSPDEIGEGAGRGYCVNVPLPPYTRDVSYLYAFQEIVPPLARAFRPEVVVSQLGADGHHLDPLTHLLLTTETYEAVGRILNELSNELCRGRWIGTAGGGYDLTAAPRVWALLFSKMLEETLEDAIPAA